MRHATTTTASGPGDGTVVPIDGRTARRERGRRAVIDAVVALLREGHAPPTTAQITGRAGVSEATLFRYFETIDDLQMQAAAQFLEQHAGLFTIPDGADVGSRVDRFVTSRLALWEAIAPIARLGRARAFDNPAMADLLRSNRRSQATQVDDHFRADLADLSPARRHDCVALLATLTSFEAWDMQRGDLDRTPTQIRRAWKLAVRALVDRATPTPSPSEAK